MALNTLLAISGFVFGSWQIRSEYRPLLSWVFRLAGTSEIHGNGVNKVVDLSSYMKSILILWGQLQIPILIVLLTVILAALFLVSKKNKNYSLYLLLVFTLIGSIIFAKYPLTHYQLPNFIVIAFVFSILTHKVNRFLPAVLSVLLVLGPVQKNLLSYQTTIISSIKEAKTLQEFIDANPSKKADVWEWGRARDFSLLWGRSWTGGSYDQELSVAKPNLFELDSQFNVIRTRHNQNKPVFDVCWDHLYIQKVSAPNFLEKYKVQNLGYTPISNTQMSLISSNHCL